LIKWLEQHKVYHQLIARWSENVQQVEAYGMGTPERYQTAIDGLPLVNAVFGIDGYEKKIPVIPQFDAILDIAPAIFDLKILDVLEEFLQACGFACYPVEKAYAAERALKLLQGFYSSLQIGEEYMQVGLKTYWNNFFDGQNLTLEPTRIFYIWSNFGMMERRKERNRIFLRPTNKQVAGTFYGNPKIMAECGDYLEKLQGYTPTPPTKDFEQSFKDFKEWTANPASHPELEEWFQHYKDKF